MFHAFDNLEPNQPTTRATWIALLSRSPQDLLTSALPQGADSQLQWLRRPETGLMMVQGRIGGTGARFNVGEITVTRCALRIGNTDNGSAVGVSYVLGRNHRQAQLAAMADALLQDPAQRERLEITLLYPIRLHLRQLQSQRQQRALTTKVDFLTVARESTGNDEEDDA